MGRWREAERTPIIRTRKEKQKDGENGEAGRGGGGKPVIRTRKEKQKDGENGERQRGRQL